MIPSWTLPKNKSWNLINLIDLISELCTSITFCSLLRNYEVLNINCNKKQENFTLSSSKNPTISWTRLIFNTDSRFQVIIGTHQNVNHRGIEHWKIGKLVTPSIWQISLIFPNFKIFWVEFVLKDKSLFDHHPLYSPLPNLMTPLIHLETRWWWRSLRTW